MTVKRETAGSKSAAKAQRTLARKAAATKEKIRKAAKGKKDQPEQATAKAAAGDGKDAKATKGKAKKDGKLSLLDASIKVLDASDKPLHVREIVESVLAKGYWKAGEGKTPHQTLAASFLKEIKRGKEARVKKVGRGEFAKA